MPETLSDSTLSFMTHVHEVYVALMKCAVVPDEPSLGGQLLYVGELDEPGRALAAAANMAGAATLAASALSAALRHAQREGAIDFVVNSLDEALRILKNEIRKHEPVAVAVSLSPGAIEVEMMERGVLPNLLPHECGASTRSPALASFLSRGAREVLPQRQAAEKLFIWDVPAEYVQNLAGLESILADHLAPADRLNRRWLRLSPRYLGPAARRLRSVACDGETATALRKRLGPPLNA